MSRHLLPLAAALALLPAAALAHEGHAVAGGFAAGFLHPLFGADHVLAMLAVGLWAAAVGGAARLAYPSVFVGGLLLGAALGLAGAPLPAVEPMILASIIILGALVALVARLPLAAATATLALLGLVHGHAHGTEAPLLGAAGFFAGFAASTVALHATGLAAGLAADRAAGLWATRILGGATAAAGLALALA
jgi:urease accessory protein